MRMEEADLAAAAASFVRPDHYSFCCSLVVVALAKTELYTHTQESVRESEHNEATPTAGSFVCWVAPNTRTKIRLLTRSYE